MIYSYADTDFVGTLVLIELELQRRIPRFDIVGLPSSEVRESRERVQQAILNSGFRWPHKRIIVNLSPADVKKKGSGFDLAFSLALLSYTRQIMLPAFDIFVIGELQFSGKIISVKECFKAIVDAVYRGIRYFVIPSQFMKNLVAHSVFKDCKFLSMGRLSDLKQSITWETVVSARQSYAIWIDSLMPHGFVEKKTSIQSSFEDLTLTNEQKRVFEIVALGRHHLLLMGPPGVGKSACASRIPLLEMPLQEDELLDVMKMWTHNQKMIAYFSKHKVRPVRCPHHNASIEGMVGGSSANKGELPLSHHGILFLDEILEYKSSTLQSLREPIDQRIVTISRSAESITYPSIFQVIATSNLCPCGMKGTSYGFCLCSEQELFKYWKRLGGPLYDRFEVKYQIALGSTDRKTKPTHCVVDAKEMQHRVVAAYLFSRKRQQSVYWNSLLSHAELDACSSETEDSRKLLVSLRSSNMYSERSILNIRRVGRTIADLALSDVVKEDYIAYAEKLVHVPMSTLARI